MLSQNYKPCESILDGEKLDFRDFLNRISVL